MKGQAERETEVEQRLCDVPRTLLSDPVGLRRADGCYVRHATETLSRFGLELISWLAPLLVMRLKDTHELLLQARPCWWSRKAHETQKEWRGERSMHGFCDTIVNVDAAFFLIFWIFVPSASGEQASSNSASIRICFLSALVISAWGPCVFCTVKCSSKEQGHLIKNVSWCCSAVSGLQDFDWLPALLQDSPRLLHIPSLWLSWATQCCSTHIT